MAPNLRDIVSFEVGTNALFVAVEGDGISGGATPTIVSSPAPFPDTEIYCLSIAQNSSQGIWNGKTHGLVVGSGYLVMCYVRFVRGLGAPFTNDITFLSLYDGTNVHISLRLTANGATNDLEVVDAAGAVCATIAGPIIVNDTWRLIRMLVKLQDADTPSGGVGGDCEVEVVDASFATQGKVIGSVSCSNENFYSGTADIGIRFGGEAGIVPAGPTTSCFGSALLFDGMSTPLDTDEFIKEQLGQYTCFGVSPTRGDNVSDVDSSGAAGGFNLDVGTWAELSDGLTGSTKRVTNQTSGDDSGVIVDHPDGDSRVTTAAIVYGMEWVWHLSPRKTADIDVYYGKQTTGGFVVQYDAAVPGGLAVGYKRVEDVTGARVPLLSAKAVIGFETTATANLHWNEAWVISAFAYPLPFAARSDGGVYSHRRRRIVLG